MKFIKTRTKNIFKLQNQYELVTPPMKLLFKVEELYNNIILKAEFVNLNTNLEMKQFLSKIQELELSIYNQFKKYINENYYEKHIQFKSQLNQQKNYNPYMIIKILKKNTKYNREILTNVFDSNNDKISVYDLKPKDLLIFSLVIDNIWISNNNEVIIKMKATKIVKNN